MRTVLTLTALLLGSPVLPEDIMLEDFDSMRPDDLVACARIKGDNIKVSLVETDERAGKQNLLVTADVDPAQPNWNHVRLRFVRRIRNPQALTFWFRGDKVARLYLILEDSKGTRTDATIGQDASAGAWHQATIRLKDMHVPNAKPPKDKATPLDVMALEVFPYPAGYPGKGTYKFQIDDISVTRPEATAVDLPLDALTAPIKNPDLEQLSADGKGFAHWSFHISRNAKVSVAVSQDEKRGGKNAALFHNESPVSPHVYGRFLQRVTVQPGTPYRLSCWVRGEGVREGNHWTDWKSYRLRIPSGTFDWKRIETDFVTQDDQTVLEVGLNIVNITDKLWIDDVELTTDVTMGETKVAGAKVALWCPRSAVADREEVPVKVIWQGMSQEGGGLNIQIRQDDNVAAILDKTWKGKSGAIEYYLRPKAMTERDHRVTAVLTDDKGEVLGRASRDIDVVSAEHTLTRLDEVRANLAKLRNAMQGWEERGLPLDYPTVTQTVTENFIPWIEEDIQRWEVQRALQQIDELTGILQAALAQCEDPPPASALTVPRYQTGEIEIAGGHFVADVKWPDGRTQRRPVFFNGYGHFSSVRRDVEKFPSYGLNIFQIEFGPNRTVKEDFEIDLGACESFESVLERAEEASVAVNLLLSPHYFPQWAFERWPELRGVKGGFNSFDIDNPRAREVEEAFLRAVIARLKDRPGLHSFCLSNEPIYQDASESEHNRRKWHEWLERRHGDIARLNALYGTNYESFEDVPVEDHQNLEPRVALYDWVTFNNERFAEWHKWMADIIHEIDPDIPVHAKIMNLPFQRHTIGWGNDVELFCDFSQIAGNDCSNNYVHDDGADWGNGWQSENQYYDLLRSMRGQPVFNSENHVVSDRNWRPVPGMHMRNLIWQGAIHGQGASTMWVWERTYDPKSSLAGSVMHRPAFCDAHGRAALDLMRLAPEVIALQDAPARVAIVYSICSQVWDPDYSRQVGAVYQALTFLGEKVDFITYRQIAKGEGGKYAVIIAPGVTHFEEEGYRALAELSRRPDRQLVTVGDACLARDEYGRTRDTSSLRHTNILLEGPQETRAALREALNLGFPVRVLDASTGELAWGVGWRWARENERWLVNVCNYTRKPMKLRVLAPDTRTVTNLFSSRPTGSVIELRMMEPILLEMRE